MSVRFSKHILATLFLLLGLLRIGFAADDLKIVLLDGKDAHALKGKLVCILLPVSDPQGAVVEHPRDCRRTDSSGTADFALPDPAPEAVDVILGSNGLVPCFKPHPFQIAEALSEGMVVKNTCSEASTDTTEKGELVLFAHQKSVKEALDSTRNEF